MTLDDPSSTDGRWELSRDNLRRLQELMGDDYNAVEMEDYLSYISPEDAKEEVDLFEEKLKSGKQSREQLLGGFKSHLGYLAA